MSKNEQDELWVTGDESGKEAKGPRGGRSASGSAANAKFSAKAAKKAPVETSRVIYIGHLPSSFVERGLRGYFSQFGDITRLRLARSKKSAKPKGYGFIEFAEPVAAKVAAAAMQGYPLDGKLLVSHVVPEDKQHPALWNGATNRAFKKRSWRAVAYKMQGRARTLDEHVNSVAGLLKREEREAAKLKELGIDYELPAESTYAAQAAARGLDAVMDLDHMDEEDEDDVEGEEGDDSDASEDEDGEGEEEDEEDDDNDEEDEEDEDDDLSVHDFDDQGEEIQRAPPSKRSRTETTSKAVTQSKQAAKAPAAKAPAAKSATGSAAKSAPASTSVPAASKRPASKSTAPEAPAPAAATSKSSAAKLATQKAEKEVKTTKAPAAEKPAPSAAPTKSAPAAAAKTTAAKKEAAAPAKTEATKAAEPKKGKPSTTSSKAPAVSAVTATKPVTGKRTHAGAATVVSRK